MSLIINRLVSFFAVSVILSTSFIFAQQGPLLKSQDIQRIMKSIFEQHVDKKSMSKEILQHSLKVYLEQFDPNKMYFLDSEVSPYLEPTDVRLEKWLALYKEGKYDPFIEMDALIKRAVERARNLRLVIEKKGSALFSPEAYTDYKDWSIPEKWPSDLSILRERMRQDIVGYVQDQKDHFGANNVLHKEAAVIQNYESNRQDMENRYIYADDASHALSSTDKDHQFALHVLKSLAKSLDSHTSFFDSSEAYDMKMRLQKDYEGTGLVFEEGLDGVVVKNILPRSPAASDGRVQVGDLLISLNGHSIENQSFSKVMEQLEGDKGSMVKMTLKRPKNMETLTVDLKRGVIILDEDRVQVSYVPYDNGIIGKIVLHSFYQSPEGVSSEKDVKNAIEELRTHGPLRGLILDLRDNSGGYLSQAVKVAGLFVSSGVIVISKYSNGEKHYYRDLDGETSYEGPLVILTSRLTASAAEIVAQALQDYGVALVVGDDRTFGKGSIQTQTVTENGGGPSFKVTVGKYYTVSGKTPQLQGVKADIVVPDEYEYEKIGEKYLENNPSAPDSVEPAYKDNLADVQPDEKGWFMHYYKPTLQPKKSAWQNMLPQLKTNSEARLSPLLEQSSKGLSHDQQSEEAINIVKDMVKLHFQLNKDQLGIYK